MQFFLTAYDFEDANERRMACREEHLRYIQAFIDQGKVIIGGAIFDNENAETRKMIGSAIICEFPSKEALHKEWLDSDPYILNRVWGKIEIKPYAIAPGFKGKKIPE